MTPDLDPPHRSSEPDEWPDIEVRVPPRLLRIEPGEYEAFSVRLSKFHAYGRENIRLDFEIYKGQVIDGIELGRVPMFLRLPGRGRLSPTSKLARLLYTAGANPKRWERINLNSLRDKLWQVQVGDAQHDTEESPLSTTATYSVIKRVLARLA